MCCEATLVAKEAKRFLDQPSFVALVRRELSLQYKRFLTLPSAAEAHKRLMGRFSGHWSKLRSHETCFSCVARRPQFGLSCGHSVCENCVKVFGNKNDLDPWVYHVNQCFICGAGVGSLAIRVRPENASIRVLSIDGGGVRGVAPLQFLRTLQDQLRLPNYPIQRHFDLIYGTSSGEYIYVPTLPAQRPSTIPDQQTRSDHDGGPRHEWMGHCEMSGNLQAAVSYGIPATSKPQNTTRLRRLAIPNIYNM